MKNHNHFIQKVNIRLLHRIFIAGNVRPLSFLGRNHLFEAY